MLFQPAFAAILGILSIATALPAHGTSAKFGKGASPSSSGKTCKRSEFLSANLVPRTDPPTYPQLEAGAAKLAWALGELGVKDYGLIGGGATALWAHQAGLKARLTEDLDLIIDITPSQSKVNADTVSRDLTTNAKTKEFFVAKCDGYIEKPFVKAGGTESAVEIFDWEVWPKRKPYYDFNLPGNARSTIKIGTQDVSTLNLGWILRQKILAYSERDKKHDNDMADIVTLHKLMVGKKLTVTITDVHEVEALKHVIADKDAPALKGTVICNSIPALT